MTFPMFRAARSIGPVGLAGLALLAQIEGAKAEVNEGLFGALARIFAPAPQPRYTPFSYVPQAPVARSRRAARPRAPRTAHASLPAEKTTDKASGKVTIREPNQNAVAELLNDKTLRRGDIVVLPSGPKVFKGGASAPFRPSDFEDPRHSKMLGEKTRRDLMALRTQPVPNRAETADKGAPAAENRPVQAASDDHPLTITVSLPRKAAP